MEGHKLRIDFIKYFQSHSKFNIDVYGYDNNHNLKNYKGALPRAREKDDGIFPYKYVLAAENCQIDGYYTEKIIDSFSERLYVSIGAVQISKNTSIQEHTSRSI